MHISVTPNSPYILHLMKAKKAVGLDYHPWNTPMQTCAQRSNISIL